LFAAANIDYSHLELVDDTEWDDAGGSFDPSLRDEIAPAVDRAFLVLLDQPHRVNHIDEQDCSQPAREAGRFDELLHHDSERLFKVVDYKPKGLSPNRSGPSRAFLRGECSVATMANIRVPGAGWVCSLNTGGRKWLASSKALRETLLRGIRSEQTPVGRLTWEREITIGSLTASSP